MSIKIFILGRPGSGKSTAARHIMKLIERRFATGIRINDYDILRAMYKEEEQSNQFKRFKPTYNYRGFDVLDFAVLDTALQEVKKRAEKSIEIYNAVVIEFARADYNIALQIFDRDFLHDAYFLFLDVDLDTCVKRVQQRAIRQDTPDDSYMSEEVLRKYYHLKNNVYMLGGLIEDYALDHRQVKIIVNTIPLWEFITEIEFFIEYILDQKVGKLLETDPIQIQWEIPNSVPDNPIA